MEAVENARAPKFPKEDTVGFLGLLAYLFVPLGMSPGEPIYATFVVGTGALILAYVGLMTLASGLMQKKTGKPEVMGVVDAASLSPEDKAHNRSIGQYRATAGAVMMGIALIMGLARIIMHGINPLDSAIW